MINRTSLLSVDNVSVEFPLDTSTIYAVNDVAFELHEREMLGIVGESGSGKSVLNIALIQLIAKPGRVVSGSAFFKSRLFGEVDLFNISPQKMRKIRGAEISVIFQDAMTALNPHIRVSEQMMETLQLHKGMNRKDALSRSIERLAEVGIPDPEKRIRQFPHEFSGGQRQRIMIAMALICDPQIVIADEPTTALDVTIQAQVLDVLKRLQEKHGTSVIFISHNLGVIAQLCHRVVVMYGGRVVESGSSQDIFYRPLHRYTHALLKSVPRIDLPERRGEKLEAIAGQPPYLRSRPTSCSFAPRCGHAQPRCSLEIPPREILSDSHVVSCFNRAHHGS